MVFPIRMYIKQNFESYQENLVKKCLELFTELAEDKENYRSFMSSSLKILRLVNI